MKNAIRSALARAGIYYAKRQYMPCGIDWLWDIIRIANGRPVKSVFDVGANVGQTTRLIKARLPGAEIHSFEPIGSTFESLRSNVIGLDGVTVHRLALSDQAGTVVMTADRDSPLNHFVESSGDADGPAMETVEAQTLDGFCRDHGVDRIDLLKVDAEGADLKVFQGAARLLGDQRAAFVFAEVGFDPSDTGHVYVAAMLEQLLTHGLEPYAFYDYCRLQPPSYEREGVGLVFANVLFVCPAALERLE